MKTQKTQHHLPLHLLSDATRVTSDSLEFLACQSGGAYLPMGLSTVLATVLDILRRESYSWEMVTTTSHQALHCHLLSSSLRYWIKQTHRCHGNSPHPTHLQQFILKNF